MPPKFAVNFTRAKLENASLLCIEVLSLASFDVQSKTAATQCPVSTHLEGDRESDRGGAVRWRRLPDRDRGRTELHYGPRESVHRSG